MLINDSTKPPKNWANGFTAPQSLKSGEVPFLIHGNWYLYIWDKTSGKQDEAVYSFSNDTIQSYESFHAWLDGQKVKMAV